MEMILSLLVLCTVSTKWSNEELFGKRCVFTVINVNGPLCFVGDFNAIRKLDERFGGSLKWPDYMNEFPDCIQEAQLSDL